MSLADLQSAHQNAIQHSNNTHKGAHTEGKKKKFTQRLVLDGGGGGGSGGWWGREWEFTELFICQVGLSHSHTCIFLPLSYP